MGPSRVPLAKIMYQRVIIGRTATLGKQHPHTLSAMIHLANLLQVSDPPGVLCYIYPFALISYDYDDCY